jgi:hypothetical protein
MIVRGQDYRRIADGLHLRYVTDHPGRTLRRTARLRKIGLLGMRASWSVARRQDDARAR